MTLSKLVNPKKRKKKPGKDKIKGFLSARSHCHSRRDGQKIYKNRKKKGNLFKHKLFFNQHLLEKIEKRELKTS